MKLRFHILIKVFSSAQLFMQQYFQNQKPNIFLDYLKNGTGIILIKHCCARLTALDNQLLVHLVNTPNRT